MLILPDGMIASENDKDVSIPFFRLAFRPFFYLGSLFGATSIAIWALVYSGRLTFEPVGGAYYWHTHEMLFGFTLAIIVGFLLTAVQTWTKVPTIKGAQLVGLVLIWCVGRLLMAFPVLINQNYAIAIELLFLPLAAVALAIPIIKAKMWKNLFFVPILLVMAVLNGAMHLSMNGTLSFSFLSLSHVMVVMITLVMCIMGGRVFPMFTANGTNTARVNAIALVEKFSIASIIASVVITFETVQLAPALEAFIYCIAAVINAFRAFRWRIWVTFNTPLVWSLHISYWSICIGLFMLGLEKLQIGLHISLAIHAVTLGGISMMVLSMISRVSLGHTGRMIKASHWMTLAFVVLFASMLVRVFAPMLFNSYTDIILLSAVLWVAAYTLFLILYAIVLFSGRIDGGKG